MRRSELCVMAPLVTLPSNRTRICQPPLRLLEDRIEHLLGEEPGLRVALAWMIRRDQSHVGELADLRVAELRERPGHGEPEPSARVEIRIEGKLAEGDDDA